MILASASSSVKTGMLLFCSLTQTVMRALCETVPRKEPLGIQDLGTFFQELPEYGQWLTGSYSPNLPNCNYHRYSWFQDLANVEKVGDLQEDAMNTLSKGDLECQGTNPQATTIPTLLPCGTHGWDILLLGWTKGLTQFLWICIVQKSIHFHSSTLSKLRSIFLKRAFADTSPFWQHVLSPNRWEWSFKSSEWRLKLLIDPIISSHPHFKLLVL